MFDFNLNLPGGYYLCSNIASATTSGVYSPQIGFNFKMSTIAPNTIMEVITF